MLQYRCSLPSLKRRWHFKYMECKPSGSTHASPEPRSVPHRSRPDHPCRIKSLPVSPVAKSSKAAPVAKDRLTDGGTLFLFRIVERQGMRDGRTPDVLAAN